MPELTGARKRLLRGAILKLLYDNHERQFSRLNHTELWGLLDRLHYDVSLNDILAMLQDLKGRGYVSFLEEKNRQTGQISISKIEIAPEGRDLVEGTDVDTAVELL